MTQDNTCINAPNGIASKPKLQRCQNKESMLSKQAVVGNDRKSSAHKVSFQVNQRRDQINGNRENFRRASPSNGSCKQAENCDVTSGMNGRRSIASNQYFVEQSGAGSRKQRQGMKSEYSPTGAQYVNPAITAHSMMPYLPITNTSSSAQFNSSATQRRSPPQPISATFFAGSKFGDAPSPAKLPPPPQRWLSGNQFEPVVELSEVDRCVGLTSGLKILLKVQ